MKLSINGIKDKNAWESQGIELPSFDVEAMQAETKKSPVWIHFGAGNIFRGYIAGLQNRLLNAGETAKGIIAAETFDYDIIDQIYDPFDNLTLMVTLLPDGNMKSNIIASIAEGVKADSSSEASIKRLKEIFVNPELQMLSFTVTEKGYALNGLDGNFMKIVSDDINNGPQSAKHAMSVVTALLHERYLAGEYPLAVVSMDNCSHNGEKLQSSVLTIANEWLKKGFVEEGFIAYLKNESKISFPWSMIDKITPRPAEIIKDSLKMKGVENMDPVITGKRTFIAPYVNAEEPQYLVIEDKFPNGRPALEKAGVFFTDRDTVNKVERMKVTTCLNPLHTALAVYGCLLGYTLIADEMKDAELSKLVKKIGYEEGMKVVTDPGIIHPKEFIDEVIEKRLPNPFMPDAPQRIATDTSQKIKVRFGETIKSYMESDNLDATSLTFIPLAIAGWLRYMLGVDDSGKEMELSADPMLAQLQQQMNGIKWNNPQSYNGQLSKILTNSEIFGVDLHKAGLADKVESMFIAQLNGAGAVRAELKKYLD